MATKLENFSLYLWKNPEGFHVTVTTNFKLPSEKRSFFSFGGQTYKSWRAYNLHQPEPIKKYFEGFKEQYKKQLTPSHQYWISKLAVNTGTKGRKTAPGAMILMEDKGQYSFIVDFAGHTFDGDFDESILTDKQRKGQTKGVCLGQYVWKDDDVIQEYVEAF